MSVPMRTAPEPDCLGSVGFETAGTLARASEGMLAIASRACDTKRRRDHEARGSSVPFGARRPTGIMTFPSMAALFAPLVVTPGPSMRLRRALVMGHYGPLVRLDHYSK